MVRALHIMSVFVAVLAGVVLASVLGLVSLPGLAGTDDSRATRVLNSPGAVERFRRQGEDVVRDDKDKTPPLVRQAEVLAGILNPAVEPVATKPTTTPRFTSPPPKPPGLPSTNFLLVGTSYCAAVPQESFAYVRMPDGVYQWVRQGSAVGHLVVKQIKDGSIIYTDGRSDGEMFAETQDTASVLEARSPAGPAVAGVPRTPTTRALPYPREHVAVPPPQATRPELAPPRAPLTEQDERDMSELVRKLKKELMAGSTSGTADANSQALDRAALAGKLISEFRSSRVSPEEAERLEDLGKELNGAQDVSPSSPTAERRREFMRRMGVLRATKP